ncbi:MAG: acyl-CoA dehydrogenase family protein, partial [Sedimentisphaerales bacterium]|nr:acyl-CoA dehydrogenase family protein [Sedimentisphaerales bacterium]
SSMANFYRDNYDIQFLFKHIDLGTSATVIEEGFRFAKEFDNAPANAEEAIHNYEMVLDSLGQLCGEFIAPRAEDVDRQGNLLNKDGSVTRAKGTAEAIEKLGQAEVMGFTLPHRFGGLNFPNLVYSMAIEILSRADAALMNIFGLQGIAETINAFASEDIKQQYLHDFSAGKVTGAMVLTEPDAGSDLQAIKVSGHDADNQKPARVYQDAEGNWFVRGVKRFITNGCGEILLVLARSEPDISDGRGLSLYLVERGPWVKVRRLEDKLGIHGSPTCELFFNDAPAKLIGERQRGLITYVMSLMNGARIGIAGQSMGIAEAAYRVARDYAATRRQFGMVIEKLPAVRDMLIDMKIAIEAGRALLYETSRVVDMEIGFLKQLETNPPEDKAEEKQFKNNSRKYKRIAAMLTPMSKYYCSEMCNTIAYDAIQVLGGSGYMRDYPCERYARDARITTIYEGTTQLQIVAAVRGVCSGTTEKFITELAEQEYGEDVKDLLDMLSTGMEQLKETIPFVKEQGNEYMDLYGRAIVDIAIDLINGYLLCGQASTKVEMDVPVAENGAADRGKMIPMKKRKAMLARRYITKNAPRITALTELIRSGDKSTFTDYEALIGPVPEKG